MRLSGQAEEAEPVQMPSIAPVTSAFVGDPPLPPGPKFWVALISDSVHAVREESLLKEVMKDVHPGLIPVGMRGFPEAVGGAALED